MAGNTDAILDMTNFAFDRDLCYLYVRLTGRKGNGIEAEGNSRQMT